jgi:hypothetical protein
MIAMHPRPCEHDFQDQTYGNGFRVMNPVYEQGKIVGARCTVCAPPKERMKRRGGIYQLSDLKILRK